MSISIGVQNKILKQLSIIVNGQASINGIPLRAALEGGRAGNDRIDHPSVVEPLTEDTLHVGKLEERARTSTCHPVSLSACTTSRQWDSQAPERCVPWCSCACHVQRSFKSPWVLETLIGRLNVSYSGPWLDCNERKCRRISAASLVITHSFPTYLMNRYITLKMRYAPLDGPTLTLRAPRVTAWSHLYWSYANKGDLTAIQRMYSQKRASPYDLNPRGSNALVYAANHTNYKISQFLIQQGADPNLPNSTGIVASEILWMGAFAGRYGYEGISIVESVLKDIDYMERCGFTTLHKIVLGIIQGDLRSELENSTISINRGDARKRTPLCWAVIRDNFDAVQTLLAFEADPNKTDDLGQSPLHFSRSPRVCRALLDAGVEVALRNSYYQRSALHCICYGYGAPEVVDLLIGASIPVDVRDMYDKTPLLYAVYWHRTAVAKRLIGCGADINATDALSQKNVIHFAVTYDHHEIIPLLLVKGAHYASIDSEGRNIAHMAAASASTKTVEVLEKANLAGLDIFSRDRNGDSPADIIARREIFGDSELGVYVAFEAFMRSIGPRDP